MYLIEIHGITCTFGGGCCGIDNVIHKYDITKKIFVLVSLHQALRRNSAQCEVFRDTAIPLFYLIATLASQVTIASIVRRYQLDFPTKFSSMLPFTRSTALGARNGRYLFSFSPAWVEHSHTGQCVPTL